MGNKLNHPEGRVNVFGYPWFRLVHEAHRLIGINLESEQDVTESEKNDINMDFEPDVAASEERGINLDFEQDVAASEKTDEICHYNLLGKCSSDLCCRDVHCDLPYQWRWRSRWSHVWTFFNEDENDGIERAFCDPTNERHNVSNHEMTIDFNSMSGKDNLGLGVEIERLSTLSSENDCKQIWRTKWLWYWKNFKGEWIKFGDMDEGCKAEIKSADLEEAFAADPTGEASFKTTGNISFNYIVNFCNMIQRNTTFHTTRELCRRPEFINKLDFELIHKGIKAPENWSIPKGKDLLEHSAIVKMNKSDLQYGEIKSLFFKSLNNVRIKSIYRIENGDLWENYLTKKSKMLKKKDERRIEEKRVFHATRNINITAICKQGFDVRLNGQATGTVYGKGCYFATDSIRSDMYAEYGTDKCMFVAKILPGEYVLGKSSYCRPPQKDESDQTSDLYDSCVDDEENPEIFVIFDNNQIYPEFVIKYTNY